MFVTLVTLDTIAAGRNIGAAGTRQRQYAVWVLRNRSSNWFLAARSLPGGIAAAADKPAGYFFVVMAADGRTRRAHADEMNEAELVIAVRLLREADGIGQPVVHRRLPFALQILVVASGRNSTE